MGCCPLIKIKNFCGGSVMMISFNRTKREPVMPIADIIVLSAIIVAFGAFALVLGWADHRTRGFHAPQP
jgi:multisubunit Na+/H+ antiporter MnhC subunit